MSTMLTSRIEATAGMPLIEALHAAVNEIAHRLTTEGNAVCRVEVAQPGQTVTVLIAAHMPGTHLTLIVDPDEGS